MTRHLMKVLVAVGITALATSACSLDDESWRPGAAESACEDSVKDSGSAQFRGVKATDLGDGTYAVVGEVNARNSFGGFVGYKPFTCAARDSGDQVTGRASLSQ